VPALLPPSIFRLAVAAPPPLPGVGRPRVLPRRLLLGVFPTLLLLQPPQLVQGIPRQRQLHSSLLQTLREVTHELVNSGLPEQLLRLIAADAPAKREPDRPLFVMLMIEIHQFPERQAPPGRLFPDILPAEALVWEVYPGCLRHLAVGNLRHVV
jgi:hypothetical protein